MAINTLEIKICDSCYHNVACNGVKGHGVNHIAQERKEPWYQNFIRENPEYDDCKETVDPLWMIALVVLEQGDLFEHECEDPEVCICCKYKPKDVKRYKLYPDMVGVHDDTDGKCPQCQHCLGLPIVVGG